MTNYKCNLINLQWSNFAFIIYCRLLQNLYTRAFRAERLIPFRKLFLCHKPRRGTAMKELSRKCHDSFRCRRFLNSTEFPLRIVRLNPSEDIRDMGIRFPIFSSVISSWTNQSSRSFYISLFLSHHSRRHPNHPPKMHYRISQWLCAPLTPGCWKREER